MRKRLFIALIFIGLAGAAVYYSDAASPETEPNYITADVTEGPLQEVVTATGSLQAVVTVEVGSELSGRIAQLLVDFNDVVTKGQPIARLDAKRFEARSSEARASLRIAKVGVEIKQAELDRSLAELEDAEANLAVLTARRDGALARQEALTAEAKRKADLGSRNLITLEETETAQMNARIAAAALREADAILTAHRLRIDVARANVDRQKADLQAGQALIPQKQALLELAEADLERTTILAPIDGVVIKRNVSEGQTVAASLETPTMFTIAEDLSEMELHARVDETDIGAVKIGQPVSFSVDAYPTRVFSGEVTQVRLAPEIVQNVVTYTVVIRTRNDQRLLLPGMTARLAIRVMETEPVVKVPIAALDFRPETAAPDDQDRPRVWVMGADQKPRPVDIAVGQQNRTQIAVESDALAVGDKVITSAYTTKQPRRLFGIKLGF
ncbi:efflux RND transporter periplasmic adaptor subunit [Thalassovita mangrovi]|uniref:Efflux RND transporter periplasmic adaptor subunit n=1 Tax=Thalassovita mangrovi TaxID=2692236 RepID=A0A6L8LK81_9RHOB|nr:efflux RND transporter periplasmic adaptor subunit [Thalassovita mangrovi]MYM54092.1 efflux RND transporter periplasmic adaptor subunit [Thalassovita mangrovi]